MVNWKANDATDRLFGALIAAHPSLKVSKPHPVPHVAQKTAQSLLAEPSWLLSHLS